MYKIINNILPWDNSHLGIHNKTNLTSWYDKTQDTMYHRLLLEDNRVIYCLALCTNDQFPCIVDDIKSLFGIQKNGIHRITLGTDNYLLYYVPVTEKGEVVYETTLNCLDFKHALRNDPLFVKKVRQLLLFSDIMLLSKTLESSIRIRKIGDSFIPIGYNDKKTMILSGEQHSILSKSLFQRWFGEKISLSDITKEMLHTNDNDTLTITANIRTQIDNIIKKYDNSYIWYGCFIIQRLSNYLIL